MWLPPDDCPLCSCDETGLPCPLEDPWPCIDDSGPDPGLVIEFWLSRRLLALLKRLGSVGLLETSGAIPMRCSEEPLVSPVGLVSCPSAEGTRPTRFADNIRASKPAPAAVGTTISDRPCVERNGRQTFSLGGKNVLQALAGDESGTHPKLRKHETA